MKSASKIPARFGTGFPSDPLTGFTIVCPQCSGGRIDDVSNPSGFVCGDCSYFAGDSAGFPDFRVASDRYLSRNQETRKARKLAAFEKSESFEGLARRYYRMTHDVSSIREERFVRHILDAKNRGHALLSRLPQTGEILEIGCGTGGFVAAAAESGRHVVGVDIASRWLVVARKRLEVEVASAFEQIKIRPVDHHPKMARLLAACAEGLPFPDASFPVVVMDSLLEHVENPGLAMAEAIRVLKPGGTFVLWFPNRRWIGTDPHVGLAGLSLFSRRLAARYVAARRGPIFWPRCGTGEEWADLAFKVDRRLNLRFQAADLGGWPRADRSKRARSARFLGSLANHRFSAGLLGRFGPIGELVIRKPAGPQPDSILAEVRSGRPR